MQKHTLTCSEGASEFNGETASKVNRTSQNKHRVEITINYNRYQGTNLQSEVCVFGLLQSATGGVQLWFS